MEYGMVRGIVKSKSLVPAEDAYVIEIRITQWSDDTLWENALISLRICRYSRNNY